MRPLLHYLAAYALLYLQGAGALPQRVSPSEVSSALTATSTGTSIRENRTCDFGTINEFFDYANKNGLNITVEVQNCQNLCLLTYGVGNPDLSGIGMMYAYSIQTGLTILIGPVYRIFYLTLAPASAFIRDFKDVQTNFFSSNAFFVCSSALATIANLSLNPPTFEIAEMQALAFLQVNSILVTFFCLVIAQPRSRWGARVLLYFVVFVLVIVALGHSHLGSDSRADWRLASDGCAHSSNDYSVIKPVPYPSWAVAIFAVAGMVLGLTMMWRQRRHLRSLARDEFEDDQWGFGQIAALTIWVPVLVELLYILNDLAQRKSKGWSDINQTISVFFSPKAVQQEMTPPSSCLEAEIKGQDKSGRVAEVASS
ncbi:hypothetical protein KXV32_002687 [Aspergillus fumigatus]|nr:hypothetical protein KXV32_002687 [Aspergillus fumigatus]